MWNREGQELGNYRLLKRIGKGGFGQVYVAEHLYLQTPAAVKLLLDDIEDAQLESFRAAFLQEGRRIAALKHPHILRVIDFNIEKSTPYLVMEYAAHGTLLDRHPGGERVATDLILNYVRQIAEALAYAHQTRLIHRDVKPANVLLDEQDTLLLSDFGIATVAHHTSSRRTGTYAGTAAYTAPEQLQGKPVPASDQYALAIMVYEWICGERPYLGSSVEVIGQHLSAPIPSLRQHDAEISPALEAVVQQALAKDPTQRFATVLDFADALGSALHPSEARRSFPQTQVSDQFRASHQEDGSGTNCSTVAPQLPLVYEQPGGRINALAWSPNGKYLAAGGEAPSLHLWNPLTGQIEKVLSGHLQQITAVSWSVDSRFVATASQDKTVRVWNIASGQAFRCYTGHAASVNGIAWSPDGTRLASASSDWSVHIWEVETGRVVQRYEGHDGPVSGLAWSPYGGLIASASWDKTVHVWEVATGTQTCCYKAHEARVRAVLWSIDGTLVASGGDDHAIHVWEASTGKRVCCYTENTSPVTAIAWSLDGVLIASAALDQTLQIWEARSGQQRQTFRDQPLYDVAWSPSASPTRLLAGASDRVKIWSIAE
ncbi:WD40 repeat domain-containing serine/threonine protein kinase [Tengunoibacter tsumagoiensis]|uniref:Serine/threonine protein kinase n=1 Tax=Tengunoibacter tsumagoiensis TaxID=2014871 RepID=A0A402A7X4_9CHLR|nr:serine/threonine-protein kinase [Tengunoibacter tsumagoiensis]GCE15267.1 serine/threonine protein kinase [Tengunoibacter tsumagoiensis]